MSVDYNPNFNIEFNLKSTRIMWDFATETQSQAKSLYHYLPLGSVLPVLTGHEKDGHACLFQSNVASMNDPNEFHLGARLFNEELERRLPEFAKIDSEGLGEKIITGVREKLGKTLPIDVFALCLSTDQDSLQQWVAYTDHGKGCNLELEVKALKLLHDNALLPVVYSRSDQESIVKRTVEIILSILTKKLVDVADPEKTLKVYQSGYTIACAGISTCFKPEAYAHESEVRILNLGNSDFELREKGGKLIPHRKLYFPFGTCLQSVMLGPQCKTAYDVQSLDVLLRKYTLNLVRGNRSSIEYRG